MQLQTTEGRPIELIDITRAPRSFINALADNQPAVDHATCGGRGCSACFGLGFAYVLVMT